MRLGDREFGGCAREHGDREHVAEELELHRAVTIGGKPPGDLGVHKGVDLDGGVSQGDGDHGLEHE